jgi:hypothetical protein
MPARSNLPAVEAAASEGGLAAEVRDLLKEVLADVEIVEDANFKRRAHRALAEYDGVVERATDRPSTIVTGESYMSIRDAPGIASIDPNHAMIPPHDATPKPDRIFGKDNQDFSFQPPARGEAVTQHANEKEANCNHAAIMF